MRLIQILLPTHDNDGQPFPHATFATVRRELTDAFGGVTAYTRAPATARPWRSASDRTRS